MTLDLLPRLVTRPFLPALHSDFSVSRMRNGRNARLVESFMDVAHEVGAALLKERTDQTNL